MTDPRTQSLAVDFFARPTARVARDLLGRWLHHRLNGETLTARVVETEAYLGFPDRASHAWRGRHTARVRALYTRPGRAYVYLIYGLHHCLNVSTESERIGAAVLFRALEPLRGLEAMARRRRRDGSSDPRELASGPGRLTQAMGVDRSHDGVDLLAGSLYLTVGEAVSDDRVVATRRVGIDYAGAALAWPLRFSIRGNRHVSRPRLGARG